MACFHDIADISDKHETRLLIIAPFAFFADIFYLARFHPVQR